jgi:hypothetical protein
MAMNLAANLAEKVIGSVRVPYGDVNLLELPADVPDELGLYLSDVLATSYHGVQDTGGLPRRLGGHLGRWTDRPHVRAVRTEEPGRPSNRDRPRLAARLPTSNPSFRAWRRWTTLHFHAGGL